MADGNLPRTGCAPTDSEHDHAWRQVSNAGAGLSLGAYSCDLCTATWRL
jgi:hypothetical protein